MVSSDSILVSCTRNVSLGWGNTLKSSAQLKDTNKGQHSIPCFPSCPLSSATYMTGMGWLKSFQLHGGSTSSTESASPPQSKCIESKHLGDTASQHLQFWGKYISEECRGTEIVSLRKPFQEGNGKQKANNHSGIYVFSKNFQRSRVTHSIHPSVGFKRAGEDSKHHSTVSKWAQPTEWTRYSVFIRTEEFSLLQVLFPFQLSKILMSYLQKK